MSTIRSDRPHRWPAREKCAALEDAECICRLYDGEPGEYQVDDAGHARGWRRDHA